MKKTIAAVATFAALGAGTLGVHALDLKGSDTLKKLTVQVIAACPGATGAINYIGGGSGAGEAAMNGASPTQAVAPMSRFLTGTGTSGVCQVDTTKAEAIEIAGDAIVISLNQAHQAACDPGNTGANADPTCQGYTNGGLNHSRTLSTNVTLTSWKDTLRLVYLGLAPNDFPLATSQNGLSTGPGDQVLAVNIARRDCEDPSRVELVNNFGKLFNVDCGTDGGCTKLQHAFRRDENSGTTDFFRETLGVESGTQFGNKGFPFCSEYVPAVTINGANTGTRANNGCTVATSATDCAAGFSCDPGQLQCAKTCTIGDDSSCSSIIPGATCHAAGVCKPGTCTSDAQCGGAAGSCDTATSLCRLPPSQVSCTSAAQCPGTGATCTIPSDMNASTGWCVKLVDAPASDTKVESRCGIPGLVGGTQPGTVATVPGEFRSAGQGVGFENQQNNDPIRRQAIGLNKSAGGGSTIRLDANPAEQVATHCGDNGVVLPSSLPSDTVKAFPNTVCGAGKLAFFPAIQIVSGANARYQLCPNGDMPLGATGWDPVIRGAIRGTGTCFAMTTFTDASNASCLNYATNRPAAAFALPPSTYVTLHAGDPSQAVNPATFDARVYNNTVWQPAAQARLQQAYTFNGQEQAPTPTPPDTATAFNQQVVGAFYRIHQTRTAKGYNHSATCNTNADCPAATPTCDTGTHTCFTNAEATCTNVGPDGTPNVCCENTINHVGCLTIASPCSLGYEGLAAASCANAAEQLITQPAAGGTQVVGTNFSVGLDHAAVSGVVKEVSGCASNACIPADALTATPPTLQYPIARDLNLSTIVGFESASVTSGELALAQCLSGTQALTSGTVNALIDANGFVPGLGNYSCCRDFNESACSATSSSSNNACANNGSVNLPTNLCAF
jgi:hypothetical protein